MTSTTLLVSGLPFHVARPRLFTSVLNFALSATFTCDMLVGIAKEDIWSA
jgi:hypothetical protein